VGKIWEYFIRILHAKLRVTDEHLSDKIQFELEHTHTHTHTHTQTHTEIIHVQEGEVERKKNEVKGIFFLEYFALPGMCPWAGLFFSFSLPFLAVPSSPPLVPFFPVL
jgi:hypothetical protein